MEYPWAPRPSRARSPATRGFFRARSPSRGRASSRERSQSRGRAPSRTRSFSRGRALSRTRSSSRGRSLSKGPRYGTPTLKEVKAVVHEIVLTLHKKAFKRAVGIQVTEVFKGGSMGQGTRVPRRYDIDLVLYSRDINPHDTLEDGYEDILEKVNDYLESSLGDQYNYEKHTKVALKFTYIMAGTGIELDVDLLLSPYWDSHRHFLEFMRTIPAAKRYTMFSASASKWQTGLIKYQPARIKELIIRTKAWRDVQWDGNQDGRPKSFAISLLVIVAYERVPAAIQRARFKTLAKRTGEEFRKLVREITTKPDLSLTIPGAPTFFAFQDLLPSKPRIIDPGNPSNNLYKSGVGPVIGGNYRDRWDIFVRKLSTFDITETPMVIMGYQ